MALPELPLPCAVNELIAHGRMGLGTSEQRVQEAAMTGSTRPLCDYPEPCACQPCQVKRACRQEVMTLMSRTSPGLFELAEVRALEDHGC